jgi:hypothetical protein
LGVRGNRAYGLEVRSLDRIATVRRC